MNSVPTAPAGRKPARTPAQPLPPEPGGPNPPLAERLRALTAVNNSAFNRDAFAILSAARDLEGRVEAFLGRHTLRTLIRGLASAGLTVRPDDDLLDEAAHLPGDMRGLLYNLQAFVALAGSLIAEPKGGA